MTDQAFGEWFPGDEESHEAAWEQLGLLLTDDLSFEKGAMLIGETRRGKSTLTKPGQGLVGEASYVSLDVATWVAKDTSREMLIGKRFGCFEEMRLPPERWFGQNRDPGGLGPASVELMLKLTSGNSQTFPRKWIGEWTGVVPIHIWIVSNKVPVLNDPVLPGRFIKLWFGESFVGREDITLKDRLMTELPGIAQKALRAYRRARGRGWLIQPRSGLELKGEIDSAADPWMAWVNEWLVVDGNGSVRCGKVWDCFIRWCELRGNLALLRSVSDSSKLAKKLKKIPTFRGVSTTENHPRDYLGLRLKTQEERKR
jgi:phage/plasmid-associated DNA primase